MSANESSSSGHKLGQIVGDWFEEQVAQTLLKAVALELGLYLDHRFKMRECRMGKILWSDLDSNSVDYDFVLELGGTESARGVPLAFFETFWRRGSRHSKDKARDDSGKLVPMRETYPTARVLGIISAGDFTQPAQELVRSRAIDLFYIPKASICKAWEDCEVPMDYSDSASEQEKRAIASNVEMNLTDSKRKLIHERLITIVGKPVFDSYVQRTVAGIAAVPIVFCITSVLLGTPVVFNTPEDAEQFLVREQIHPSVESMTQMFRYEVTFSDGNMFQRDSLFPEEALALHRSVGTVAKYFENYYANKSKSL